MQKQENNSRKEDQGCCQTEWKRSETGSMGVAQGSSGHFCCAVSGSVGPVALHLVSPLPILSSDLHNILWGSSELSKNGPDLMA